MTKQYYLSVAPHWSTINYNEEYTPEWDRIAVSNNRNLVTLYEMVKSVYTGDIKVTLRDLGEKPYEKPVIVLFHFDPVTTSEAEQLNNLMFIGDQIVNFVESMRLSFVEDEEKLEGFSLQKYF